MSVLHIHKSTVYLGLKNWTDQPTPPSLATTLIWQKASTETFTQHKTLHSTAAETLPENHQGAETTALLKDREAVYCTSTYIPPSSWPQRRSSPRPWWGRCCRSRWLSGWSWWNTERWCKESPCQGHLPIGPSHWRCSGKVTRCWGPAGRASCPSWWCWWLRQWPRSLRCCTCWQESFSQTDTSLASFLKFLMSTFMITFYLKPNFQKG